MSNTTEDKIPEEVRDRISDETEQYLKQGHYGSVEAIKLAVGKAYATAAQREYLRSQQQGPRWVKIEGGEQPLEYDHVLLYWEGLCSYATGSFINGKWVGDNKQPFWALPDYWAPLPPGPNESPSTVYNDQIAILQDQIALQKCELAGANSIITKLQESQAALQTQLSEAQRNLTSMISEVLEKSKQLDEACWERDTHRKAILSIEENCRLAGEFRAANHIAKYIAQFSQLSPPKTDKQ